MIARKMTLLRLNKYKTLTSWLVKAKLISSDGVTDTNPDLNLDSQRVQKHNPRTNTESVLLSPV